MLQQTEIGSPVMKRTIVVEGGTAGAALRLEAARNGWHGVEIRSIEQVAARLAGGFLQPIDSRCARRRGRRRRLPPFRPRSWGIWEISPTCLAYRSPWPATLSKALARRYRALRPRAPAAGRAAVWRPWHASSQQIIERHSACDADAYRLGAPGDRSCGACTPHSGAHRVPVPCPSLAPVLAAAR